MTKVPILIMLAVLLLIPGCSGETNKGAGIPPPEGYASWKEYDAANPDYTTKTLSEEEKKIAAQNIEALEGLADKIEEQAEKDIEEAKAKYGRLDDYFDPIRIEGSGDKTTAPFTVTTDEWIIDWSYSTSEPEYSVFWCYVFPRGETVMYVEGILFPEETSGSTYCYAGPGEYYVKVGAANIDNWTITIKPPN